MKECLVTYKKFVLQGVKEINHSQFANDTLLMGGASTIIAERLNTMLKQFLNASRG